MARPKTGGRQKGTPNKRTAELREQVAKSGLTPLDHMLKIMWDPKAEPALRMDAAKAAAPYCHSKLSTVEVGGSGGQPLVVNITGKAAML